MTKTTKNTVIKGNDSHYSSQQQRRAADKPSAGWKSKTSFRWNNRSPHLNNMAAPLESSALKFGNN